MKIHSRQTTSKKSCEKTSLLKIFFCFSYNMSVVVSVAGMNSTSSIQVIIYFLSVIDKVFYFYSTKKTRSAVSF